MWFWALLENKVLLRANMAKRQKIGSPTWKAPFNCSFAVGVYYNSACKHPHFNFIFFNENYPISYSVFPSSYFSFLWFTKRKKIGKKHEINKAIKIYIEYELLKYYLEKIP
jgi:hypothetical protein